MKEQILVTGGSGFLGSALVRRLLGEGCQVVVLDDNSRGTFARFTDAPEDLVLIDGDIRDEALVQKCMNGCNGVFHLAFVNGTRFFYEKPELVLDVGVRGALNSIRAAKDCAVDTFVLASSSEVYQQPTQIPTAENERCVIPDIQNPRFSYAGGKLISELLSINCFRESNLRDLIFRPHNVFGPNMGFEHVIPEIIKKLFDISNGWTKSSVDLQIQGTGEETRAFCFVDDAVDQIYCLYQSGLKGEIYHIGVAKEISINELVSAIGAILNIRIRVIPGDLRYGGTSRRCPDISKIRKLGYEPKDQFADGLEKTVTWYKNYLSKKK